MSFKAKLAFFQANAQSQPQQPVVPNRMMENRNPRQATFALSDSSNSEHHVNSRPHSPKASNIESHSPVSPFSPQPQNMKPSIVVPKPSPVNNFKAKLNMFNQQNPPLAPLHPRSDHTAGSNFTRNANSNPCSENTPLPSINDHRPKPGYNNAGNYAGGHLLSSTELNKAENSNSQNNSNFGSNNNEYQNENVPQPLIHEYKGQPKPSFKDKIALVSALQQPMGAFDYQKKRQQANHYHNNDDEQTSTPKMQPTPMMIAMQAANMNSNANSNLNSNRNSSENLTQSNDEYKPQLPMIRGGQRRPGRRPPTLAQPL
ncbi:hypothetical protein TRFO_13029 [Tritrichomonas foetus]|uniref:Uncharacterized protein n=1 Tax=Tritrichomonas foetus TaxID=1144522 RepID=A0A1J4KZN7_9EUKA|nr:hypothetical protein TRFO_13029 [Tritrichomonas foetus]|eukprot:OHT16618.1 hypothetical protein TRFO_13029 [Tritrichomonas foetus]